MKISELQELLDMTKERHGDLEVGFKNHTPFFGTSIMSINKLEIRRDAEPEVIDVNDEPLAKSKPPMLVFDNISDDEEVESDDRPPRATHPNT